MALLLSSFTGVAGPHLAAQRAEADVSNFRAAEVSSAEMRITVDYTYTGAMAGRVLLHVAPELGGGVVAPRLFEAAPVSVRSGAFTTTLTLRKRDSAGDFTSVAMRVCLSAPDRALVCRTFPHVKRWTGATPPTDHDAPPESGPGKALAACLALTMRPAISTARRRRARADG